ncbi:MAG: transglycosylase domain-containing protein, partial [Pyrinomonadaceae bacterium]
MAIEITSVPEPRRLPPFRRASQRVQQEATRARGRAGLLRLLVAGLIVSAGALVVTLAYFYVSYSKIVDERLASGYLTSRAGIYAAPRVLRNGQRVSRERLVEILRRAGYVDAEASNVWSGRFIAQEDSVLIHPRRGTGAAGETQPFDEVRVEFDKKNRISNITADGASLASYALEPEALTNDAHMKTGERATLAYGDIPPVLARAILSIEDRRFFEHRGVDGLGIARAVWTWAVSGAGGGETRRQQGGSTITQQLVKNTYLSPERTLRRKFNEAVIASVLERRLSKEDIFALYCNEIYLGQRGGVGVRG